MVFRSLVVVSLFIAGLKAQSAAKLDNGVLGVEFDGKGLHALR